MNQALSELWALQQIDSHILDVERQIAKLDSGADATAERDSAQTAYDTALGQLHAIDTELKDVDLNMKSTEQKRADFEKKLYSGKVTVPKELEAIQDEIKMLAKHKDTLETRELELMEAQKEAQAAVEATKTALDEKQQALNTVIASSAGELSRLKKELAETMKSREPQAVSLSKQSMGLFKKYENLRPRLGGIAVSKVEGTSCSACRVQLTSGLLREVRAGEDVAVCESCGRILVTG